jgi:hypothetical protein
VVDARRVVEREQGVAEVRRGLVDEQQEVGEADGVAALGGG